MSVNRRKIKGIEVYSNRHESQGLGTVVARSLHIVSVHLRNTMRIPCQVY